MTVSSTTSAVVYTGTGTTAVYPYTWQISQPADLVVNTVDATGAVRTTLVLNTDYTVSGAGIFTGGNVTLLAGNLATGVRLWIGLDPSILQLLQLLQGAAYNPGDVMNALDLLTKEMLACRRNVDNSLRFPNAESQDGYTSILPLKALRKSALVGFDVNGNVMAAGGTGSVAISAAMTAVVQASTLAAARSAMGPWSDALATATSGTTSRSLAAHFGDILNLRDFGATGDGTTDDTTAVQAAFTWLGGASYRRLRGSQGNSYKINGTITITGKEIDFDGDNCAFIQTVNTPAGAVPSFKYADATSNGYFVKLANLTLRVDTAVGKGHGFAFIGTGLNPTCISLDNVRVNFHAGLGLDQAGAAMPAHAVYAYGCSQVTLRTCNFQTCSGGVWLEAGFKIDIDNTTIDACPDAAGLTAKTMDNVVVHGGSIINGCGKATDGALYFDGVSSLVFEGSRIKGGLGCLIKSGDVRSRGVRIAGNQFEHYSTTAAAVSFTTAVLCPEVSENVFKFIPVSGTTQTTGIEVVDVGGGGQTSQSGRITGNYFYVVGANTLADAIKLNATLNSVRIWAIEANIIGAATLDTVTGAITRAINLAGTGFQNRVQDNRIGGDLGVVSVGITVGSGHTSTIVDNNMTWGTVTTAISDSGVSTRLYETGTFTPVVEGITSAGAGTYSVQIGRYVRQGNLVSFTLALVWSAHTGTGNMRLSGMPYAFRNLANYVQTMQAAAENLSFGAGTLCITGLANQSKMSMSLMATGAALAAIAMDTAGSIYVTGTYEI